MLCHILLIILLPNYIGDVSLLIKYFYPVVLLFDLNNECEFFFALIDADMIIKTIIKDEEDANY